MVVTSPPYWGLRAYGTEPQEWADGWVGELGSEPTIEMFVEHICEVFDEVHRVLRDDGLLFLNIGDSYAAQRGGTTPPAETVAGGVNGYGDEDAHRGRKAGYNPSRNASAIGLKHKDMCLIPERVLFALQARGWYVRDKIVWHKPAPMPESVTDRCTKSWEPVFMLAKNERYFADMEAVKEQPVTDGLVAGSDGKSWHDHVDDSIQGDRRDAAHNGKYVGVGGRNLRNVWTITTEPLSMPHFAAYPTELPARCIKIGTSEKGVCPECGNPWVRTTSRRQIKRVRPTEYTKYREVNGQPNQTIAGVAVETTGWEPTCQCSRCCTCGTAWTATSSCDCEGCDLVVQEPIPATVLDPFLGSGSTSVAAERLGRFSIGCELNEAYARDIAVLRIQTALEDGAFKAEKPMVGQRELF